MKEKYLVPPFSVLFGNKPDWIARKRKWIDFGIRSEIGRGDELVYHIGDWIEKHPLKGGAS